MLWLCGHACARFRHGARSISRTCENVLVCVRALLLHSRMPYLDRHTSQATWREGSNAGEQRAQTGTRVLGLNTSAHTHTRHAQDSELATLLGTHSNEQWWGTRYNTRTSWAKALWHSSRLACRIQGLNLKFKCAVDLIFEIS